ncbi:MAG: hypothetical protein ACK4ZS_05600, partial [Sulfurimicrobium sp.]
MKSFPLRLHGGQFRVVWGVLALAFVHSTPADTLSFAQCVDTALRQNPGLSASRAQLQQAEAGLAQA